MTEKYTMPAVHVGDVVLWRHNRTSPQPAAALVTAVGDRAVGLILFPGDTRAGIPKDGVRHESDPELNRVLNDAGVWSYTESAKWRQEVDAAVALLRARSEKK